MLRRRAANRTSPTTRFALWAPAPQGARTRGSVLVLVAAAVVALLAGGTAHAGFATAEAGDITATLEWEGSAPATSIVLTIRRQGIEHVFRDPLCGQDDYDCNWHPSPAAWDGHNPLAVGDVDGDGESEVVTELFTGGANCCFVALMHRWSPSYGTYVQHSRDFGSPFRFGDANGDGTHEFVGSDRRFRYRFGCGACSAEPIRVIGFAAGTFRDVTRQHRPLVRADAARLLRHYRRLRRGEDARGLLSAWAADKRLLGQGRRADVVLRRAMRRGQLRRQGAEDTYPADRRYLRELRGFLRRLGY